MSKDYYKILDIEKNASPDEIKKAFRKKAHEHHPDKGNGNADKFKEINEAYQTLGNAEKKKQYDQFGSNFGGGASVNWSDFAQQAGKQSSGFGAGGIDLGDIFSDFFSGRGGSPFSGGGGSQSQNRRGLDIEANLTIDFNEAVFGVEKVLDISKQVICSKCNGQGNEPGTRIETCKTCNGSGQVTVTQQTFFGAFRSVDTCNNCHGEGKVASKKCSQCAGQGAVRDKERIKIQIPKGISNGETIKLTGKGEAGQRGAGSGDLYINIGVRPSLEFNRQGYDIFSKLSIPFSQGALGAKVKVKTLDGEVNLKIPAGTAPGKQFILKDRGVPKLRGRGRGDHIVQVDITVPKDLNRQQKKLLDELASLGL